MGQLAFESSPAENWMDDVTGISVSPDDSEWFEFVIDTL